MTHTIISTSSDTESREMGHRLREFNSAVIGEFETQSVRLSAKGSNGEIVGGLIGRVALEWLEIHVLWVDEKFRGQGVGANLVAEAESRAKGFGAKNAFLDTFEWQAQGFYEHFGYAEFGRLENFPTGFHRFFVSKEL